MQAVIYLLAFSFAFVSSDVVPTPTANDSLISSTLNETAMPTILLDVTEPNGTFVFDVYHKISEGQVDITNISERVDDMDWLLEINKLNINSSFEGVDDDGCDRSLRHKLEAHCDDDYERVSFDAHDIEDLEEKTEALCCAVEEFEKCNLRAFDKANCGKDKTAIRGNMQAARLFITVIANVTCTRFRGLCAYSSAPAVSVNYVIGFGAVLFGLVRILV